MHVPLMLETGNRFYTTNIPLNMSFGLLVSVMAEREMFSWSNHIYEHTRNWRSCFNTDSAGKLI
jgi:hypothetical protein